MKTDLSMFIYAILIKQNIQRKIQGHFQHCFDIVSPLFAYILCMLRVSYIKFD